MASTRRGAGELIAETTARIAERCLFPRAGAVAARPREAGCRADDRDASARRLRGGAHARAHVVRNSTRAGRRWLIALPTEETPNMADDNDVREMTSDPKFRKVLVTDGKSVVGQAARRRACKAAAPDIVWVGVAEPWNGRSPARSCCAAQDGIEIVPLDATDEKSRARSRGRHRRQGRYPRQHDGICATARPARPQGHRASRAPRWTRPISASRLAQAFGPAMRMRGADGINNSDRVGQHSLDLCAGELACARRLLGLASGVPVALALPARRAAARRRPGDECVHRARRRRVESRLVPPPKVAPRAHRAGDRVGAAGRARGRSILGDVAAGDPAASRGQSEGARARARQVTSRFQPSRRT